MKTTYKPLGEMVLVEWAVLKKKTKTAKFTSSAAGDNEITADDEMVLVLTDLGESEVAGAVIGDFILSAVDVPPPSDDKLNGSLIPAAAIIGKMEAEDSEEYDLVYFKEM